MYVCVNLVRIFMFSNFYWLDLHNKTCFFALANLRWDIYKSGLKIGPPLIWLWLSSKWHEGPPHPMLWTLLLEGSMTHVCVCWFGTVFHVLQLLPIGCTQIKLVFCISKSTMRYLRNPGWKLDLRWYGYDYLKCMFVDFLAGCIGPPNCVHYWV
jgi:hypothetical protein